MIIYILCALVLKIKITKHIYIGTLFTVGYKSYAPFFDVYLMEGGVIAFVAHCTLIIFTLNPLAGKRNVEKHNAVSQGMFKLSWVTFFCLFIRKKSI